MAYLKFFSFVVGFFFLFALSVVPTSSAAKKPMILERANGTEPEGLDPHIVTGVPEHHILVALLEGLVSVHPKTLEPQPGVAESWTPSEDKLNYTFKLNKNAKWSNGDPVTAQDFVYSWTRLLLPKTAAQYAYQGYVFKNGEKFNKGEIKDPKQLGFKAVDAHTLKVTLEKVTPYFLGLLYHYSLYPVHRKTVEKHGSKWTRPENYVGNGPFVIKSWAVNKVIKTLKNPKYWDAKTVKLDGVNFYAVEKSSTEERMFRKKVVHVTNEVPIEKIPFWQRDKSGVYQQSPYLGTYYYLVNTKKKPFNDKRVRKALALAIDRQRLVKFVTRGGQLPGVTFTPPGTGGYEPPKGLLPNDLSRLTEAKQLLADAGYPNGKDFPPFEILYNTLESHQKIAEAIQQMWKENLGISATPYNQEWKVYLATRQHLDFDVARAGWIGDYNDPMTFLDMFAAGSGNNDTGWSNKTYDKLIAQVNKETSKAKRHDAFRKAEKLLLEEMPVIPIYVYTRVYLKSRQIAGWYPNVQDYHPLKYVSIVGE